MVDHILKRRHGNELHRQLPELLRAGHGRSETPGRRNGCEREPERELAGESEGGETERPQPQVKGQDPRAQEGPQEAEHEEICRAFRFHISKVMMERSLGTPGCPKSVPRLRPTTSISAV